MNIIKNKKVFYSGLIYLIAVMCYIAVRLLWQYFNVSNSFDPDISDLLFTVFVQSILFFVPFILYKVFCKQTLRETGSRFFFKKISFRTILFSLLIGVLTYIIVVYVSSFWAAILEMFGYTYPSSSSVSTLPIWLSFLITFVSTAILPAIGEETSHRGLMLGNLRDNGLRRAVILSALLFGLAHLSVTQFGYAFVVGIILATVTLITRSIFPAMIIHGTSNFCSTYLGYATSNEWFGSDMINWLFNLFNSPSVIGIILSILLFMGAIIGIKFMLPKLFIEAKRDKFAKFKQNLQESVRGTEMENMIDFSNQHQLVALFNEATAKDMQNKFDSGKINVMHLEEEFRKSPTSAMMYSEIDEYTPPNKMDNIFTYVAIFLMSFITIATFIWGAM